MTSSSYHLNSTMGMTKKLLLAGNKYPESYRHVKKIMKNLGMEYEIIHACQYGCALYYEDTKILVCRDRKYVHNSNTPKRVLMYFSLTPRLKRLFLTPHRAKKDLLLMVTLDIQLMGMHEMILMNHIQNLVMRFGMFVLV